MLRRPSTTNYNPEYRFTLNWHETSTYTAKPSPSHLQKEQEERDTATIFKLFFFHIWGGKKYENLESILGIWLCIYVYMYICMYVRRMYSTTVWCCDFQFRFASEPSEPIIASPFSPLPFLPSLPREARQQNKGFNIFWVSAIDSYKMNGTVLYCTPWHIACAMLKRWEGFAIFGVGCMYPLDIDFFHAKACACSDVDGWVLGELEFTYIRYNR